MEWSQSADKIVFFFFFSYFLPNREIVYRTDESVRLRLVEYCYYSYFWVYSAGSTTIYRLTTNPPTISVHRPNSPNLFHLLKRFFFFSLTTSTYHLVFSIPNAHFSIGIFSPLPVIVDFDSYVQIKPDTDVLS